MFFIEKAKDIATTKKARLNEETGFFVSLAELLSFDSAGRADGGAGAAVEAGVRVNRVDVAFLDSADGAFALAGTASNAEIGINLVSHNSKVLLLCYKFQILPQK